MDALILLRLAWATTFDCWAAFDRGTFAGLDAGGKGGVATAIVEALAACGAGRRSDVDVLAPASAPPKTVGAGTLAHTGWRITATGPDSGQRGPILSARAP